MKLMVLDGFFIIEKADIDKVILPDSVFSIIYESDAVSYIYRVSSLPENKTPWRCLKINEHLDFAMSGVLINILNPLANSGISVLVNSSFETDYIYVKGDEFSMAINKLKGENFII